MANDEQFALVQKTVGRRFPNRCHQRKVLQGASGAGARLPTGRCEGADEGLGCDSCMIGPILAAHSPKTGATPAAGAYSVWFCTLTARNRLDISASQWNTSPIYGKVGSAVGLKSLLALAVSCRELIPISEKSNVKIRPRPHTRKSQIPITPPVLGMPSILARLGPYQP